MYLYVNICITKLYLTYICLCCVVYYTKYFAMFHKYTRYFRRVHSSENLCAAAAAAHSYYT